MKCEVKTAIVTLHSLQVVQLKFSKYRIETYFGGQRSQTRDLNYYLKSEEIQIEQQHNLESIQGKQIQFWLFNSKNNQFVASGIYNIEQTGMHLVDICIDAIKVAVLSFSIEMEVKDIYQQIVLDDENLILKKDNSEEERLQQEQKQAEEQAKKDLEEQEQLKKAQQKTPLVTLTTKYKINEAYI